MYYTVLGADGFGRSDNRANLRRHFAHDVVTRGAVSLAPSYGGYEV